MSSEWESCTLGDILTLQRGMDLPSQNRAKGRYPVVASTGVVGFHTEGPVKGPGVVIGRSGSIGGGQFIDQDFWPLNTTLWVKDFKGNDPRYCYYLLKSIDFKSMNAGSGVPTLNRNHLHPMGAIKAPLKVQKEIAGVLGNLDDRITLLRETNTTLEAIAQALFKSWFVDFDPVHAKMQGRAPEGMNEATAALLPGSFEESEFGVVPKGWATISFRDSINVIGGGTPKTSVPEYWGGNIPWFSVVDAPGASDVFVVDTEKHITEAGLNGSSTKLLQAGTTIISARGTVGRLALTGGPMAMNQSCYGLRGKAGDQYFTYFSTTRLVEQLKQRAHGSVFDTITQETFAGVSLCYPSVEVIQAFEQLVEPLLMRIRENLIQANSLSSLRDTLLPRLISGQLQLTTAEAQVNA